VFSSTFFWQIFSNSLINKSHWALLSSFWIKVVFAPHFYSCRLYDFKNTVWAVSVYHLPFILCITVYYWLQQLPKIRLNFEINLWKSTSLSLKYFVTKRVCLYQGFQSYNCFVFCHTQLIFLSCKDKNNNFPFPACISFTIVKAVHTLENWLILQLISLLSFCPSTIILSCND